MPDTRLQALDLLRQRRLRDVQPLRRPPEVQLLGKDDEIVEMGELQPGSLAVIHMTIISIVVIIDI